MSHFDVMTDATVDETVHGDRTTTVRRQALRLPETDAAPALAVERTVAPGGATRPPVLLIHGLAQNRYSWRLSGRSLCARLAESGHDVYNLELRGHGLSREYGARNATSVAQYVVDAARTARACPEPPFVIGHSLGGAVGVGAATVADLRGLVHLGGVFSFASANPTLRAIARLTLRVEPRLRRFPARMSTRWAGDLLGRLYRITDIAGFGFPIAGWTPGSMERDLLEERLALGFDWESLEVWIEMSRWARGEPFPWAEDFSGLNLPLLVISGDHDVLSRPSDGRACFEASGASDRTHWVFDSFEHERHWGHIDLVLGSRAPHHVWPRLLQWLADR